MQPFTLQAPYRIETHAKVWDSATAAWKMHKLVKPRFIANPPQELTEEQTAYLNERRELLTEIIQLQAGERRRSAAEEQAGPSELLYSLYQILQAFGFGEVEETLPMRQLISYVWHLVDRYNDREITWDSFRDEVDRWHIAILEKLESHNGHKKAKTHAE